jgi:hypothetical protein
MKTEQENPKGLHMKYSIRRIVGWKREGGKGCYTQKPITKAVDDNAEYFVLRLDTGGSDINHIKACRIAIHAYADAIEATIPELAKDLRKCYPKL